MAAAAQGRSADLLTIFEAFNQNSLPPAGLIKAGEETPETMRKKLKFNKGGGICRRANCCQKKSIVE